MENIYTNGDFGVIREYLEAGLLEEPVVFKLYQSTTAGDPTRGVAKTFVYISVASTAIISAIEQADIVYSGGIYKIGDIKLQTPRLLKEVDDTTQSPGDRVIWRGNEYRPVGKSASHYIGSYLLYDYVFRRV